MARSVGGGLGGGGLGFLVLGLAVDDAGHALARILPHPLPDAHHVPAGRVHQFASLGHQLLLGLHLRPEGRDDDHVPGLQSRQFRVRRLGGNDLNAHVANLVVDLRVVDDFPQQINRFGRRKDPAGGVGQVDGALDPVAKAEFLGQLDGQQAVGGKDVALFANAVDQVAPVMREHLGLHGLHHIGPAQVYLLSLQC